MKIRDFQASFDVYMPRWGHAQTYQISMTRTRLRVVGDFPKQATYYPKRGWTGFRHKTGNSLLRFFENDIIHAPAIVPTALVSAWDKWLEGGATDAELRRGLAELFKWLDTIARGKPSGMFWKNVFF